MTALCQAITSMPIRNCSHARAKGRPTELAGSVVPGGTARPAVAPIKSALLAAAATPPVNWPREWLAIGDYKIAWSSTPHELSPATGSLQRPCRAAGGGGVTRDQDVPVALAVGALPTLRGMRREITTRLGEIQLGGEEGQRLGGLSRAARTELARRETGGEPRCAV